MLSRPRRLLCKRLAPSSTRRCLLIAWRVTREPAVSWEMDIGPPSQRREMSHRRVRSPSAEKRSAEFLECAPILELRLLDKVFLDEPGLHFPPTLVSFERFGAPSQRNLIEPGFGDRQQNTARGVRQIEFDQRRRLLGIVDALLHSVGMPAERDSPHRFDAFHRPLKSLSGVGLL